MTQLQRAFVGFALCATSVHASFAATPPNQVSLNLCQKTVKAEGVKFVKAEIAAIGACLQKVSAEQIGHNPPFLDNDAARTCITQFRKLNDTRNLGKSLIEKFTTKVQKKCDHDFNPLLAHMNDDVTGKGSPTVPKPINTQSLDLWCQNWGGDGSIDGVHTPPETTVHEWIDCMVTAHQCEVNQAIAEQYPRASEWLLAVKLIMPGIPNPSGDPTKNSDAQAGLTAVRDAIDPDHDLIPNINCPGLPPVPSCSTACCYIEQANGPVRPTSCFEYTGDPGEVATFKSNCGAATSAPIVGFYTFTATNGACSAGPMFGVGCAVGSGSNAVAIPKDSACP